MQPPLPDDVQIQSSDAQTESNLDSANITTEHLPAPASVNDTKRNSPQIYSMTPTNTFSNAFLNMYGSVINTVHHVLICVTCNRVVNYRDARKHIFSDNKHVRLPLDFSDAFRRTCLECYPELIYPPPVLTEPVAPVFGLLPPQPDVQFCTKCHKGYRDSIPSNDLTKPCKSFKKHGCTLPHSFTVHFAQRFGPLQTNPWFQVEDIQMETPSPNPWTEYQARLNARPEAPVELSLPENYRVLHQFLAKSRWLKHVEGKDTTILTDLVTVAPTDTDMPGLKRHVEAFLAKLQVSLPPGEHWARRVLSTCPT
jgi:hypothetical protein